MLMQGGTVGIVRKPEQRECHVEYPKSFSGIWSQIQLQRRADSLWNRKGRSVSRDSKWSVVITSYGVGHRIERAVQSIVDQTVDPVEFVVVDDASDDIETRRALDRIAGSVEIVRLPERQGVGVARNTGVRATTRPLVLCLDGDDWVDPAYLEMAQAVFEDRPEVGIVSAWVRFEGERTGEWRSDQVDILDFLASNLISSASTFRREASAAVGYYAEDLIGYEDWEHWIAIAAKNWKVHVIPEVLVHYDWRPGSLGRSSDKQARRLVQDIVSRHEYLFRENVGPVLGAMREQILRVEGEARSAWADLEAATLEIQKVWGLVGELGNTLEKQGYTIDTLIQELERTRQRVSELEGAGEEPNGQRDLISGSQEDQ